MARIRPLEREVVKLVHFDFEGLPTSRLPVDLESACVLFQQSLLTSILNATCIGVIIFGHNGVLEPSAKATRLGWEKCPPTRLLRMHR